MLYSELRVDLPAKPAQAAQKITNFKLQKHHKNFQNFFHTNFSFCQYRSQLQWRTDAPSQKCTIVFALNSNSYSSYCSVRGNSAHLKTPPNTFSLWELLESTANYFHRTAQWVATPRTWKHRLILFRFENYLSQLQIIFIVLLSAWQLRALENTT